MVRSVHRIVIDERNVELVQPLAVRVITFIATLATVAFCAYVVGYSFGVIS